MNVSLPITVVAFETDYDGVVSNTRYMEYLERGRYALLHASGLKVREVLESHGVQAVVRHIEIDFVQFAMHEDELMLRVWVENHSGATTTLRSELTRMGDGAVIMRAMQLLAYTNSKRKAVRVPQIYREALKAEGNLKI